jgi:hypothetical protein
MFQRFRAAYAPLRDDVLAGSTWQHERLATVEGYLDFAAELVGRLWEVAFTASTTGHRALRR